MPPRRGVFRVVMMLWAVLQVAAPTIAVVADTAAPTASIGAHPHVESRSDGSCVRVHDAECAFCQFLSNGATPAGSMAAATIAVVVRQAIDFPALFAEVRGPASVSLPRGPPLA